jgi:anthranilate phosphoribosyltransferase
VHFDSLGGWPAVLARLIEGRSLDADEAFCVLGEVLDGRASQGQVGAFLIGLRAKGETTEEMTGLVRALLSHATPLPLPGDLSDMVDVVGTGGDRLGSINVSTLAAFVLAGAGTRVCKHGNRAVSSSVGTADVLEALGVAVDLDAVGVARCMADVGMAFCFAQRFHPGMRHLAAVRRELGVPTVLNFLGPLANPARTQRQLVGDSDRNMATKMAEVLGRNGSRRSMVVYADDGLDEISVTSGSTALELTGDGHGRYEVRTVRITPADFGFAPATMHDLRGGDAAFNADVIRAVLDGERSPRRDIGVLNAAAALVVAGRVDDLGAGVTMAAASIDDGRAAAALRELVRCSQEALREQDGTPSPAPGYAPG